MSILDDELTKLIACDLKISPDQVTTEYIHKWREEHLYPRLKATVVSKYGGYNPAAKRILNDRDIEAQRNKAEEILRRLANIELPASR
jgi:hypothetical protein